MQDCVCVWLRLFVLKQCEVRWVNVNEVCFVGPPICKLFK